LSRSGRLFKSNREASNRVSLKATRHPERDWMPSFMLENG
jgi:hypothetical protein